MNTKFDQPQAYGANTIMVWRFAILLVLASTALISAQTAPKKVVTTEADLPRFSYPVVGDVQHLLNMPTNEFSAFTRPIRADIDNTLRDYDIQDHAAHRKLLHARLELELLSGVRHINSDGLH